MENWSVSCLGLEFPMKFTSVSQAALAIYQPTLAFMLSVFLRTDLQLENTFG